MLCVWAHFSPALARSPLANDVIIESISLKNSWLQANIFQASFITIAGSGTYDSISLSQDGLLQETLAIAGVNVAGEVV